MNKRISRLAKKVLLALTVVSLLTSNVFAISPEETESIHDELSNLNNIQLDFGQSSRAARSISRKISAALKQINNAISAPEDSCSSRLKTALSRLSRAIDLLNKRDCSQFNSHSCIQSDVVQEFVPQFQEIFGLIQSTVGIDEDENNVLDVCNSDPDGDGIARADDNCPLIKNPRQVDLNQNGVGDSCDLFICCDSVDPEARDLCEKRTIKSCREDDGVVIDCIGPLPKGKPTLSEGIVTFTVIERDFFQMAGEPVTSHDYLFDGTLTNTSGGTTSAGNTLTGNTSSGGTSSGNTSGGTTIGDMSNPTTMESNEDFLKRLEEAINMSEIPSMEYTEEYVCGDFADDLEQELEAEGFDATFTAIWTDDGSKSDSVAGHALTDVHSPDGGIIWIEPQTGEIVSLDEDGDGKVMASDGKHNADFMASEGMSQIEVYDDKESASKAGVPM